MKRRLLALLGGAFLTLSAWAQTDWTDVTSVITNPSFETDAAISDLTKGDATAQVAPTGWTVTYDTGSSNKFTQQWGTANSSSKITGIGSSHAASAGDKYFYLRENWHAMTYSISQTIDAAKVPDGFYKLTVKLANFASSSKAYTLSIQEEGESEVTYSETTTGNSSWQDWSVVAYKKSDATSLTIKVSMAGGSGSTQHYCLLLDDFQLKYVAPSSASSTNTFDITSWVENPSFELNTFNGTQADGSSSAGNGQRKKPTGYTCYFNVSGWEDCAANTTNPADGTYCMNAWFGGITEMKFYQTIDYLPEGVYEISAQVRTDQTSTDGIYTYGIAGGKTYKSASWDASKMAGTWNSMENWQTLTARASVIGGGSLQFGLRSDKFVQFDDFHLTYLGSDLLLSELKTSFSTKQTTATALLSNSDYDNVIGTERTTLTTKNSVKPDETVSAWETAVDELQDAIDAFTAAKDDYDQYAEAAAIASAISATSVTAPTTAAEAATRAQELNVNIDTKVTSTYTYDVTKFYVGDWSSDLTMNQKGQHWSGDESITYMDKWLASGNSTATQTLSLPAGEYILKVAGRGGVEGPTVTMSAAGNTVTFKSKGDDGVGVDKTGAANFASTDDTYCNSNNGRGWEWRFIPLSLADATDVTVTLSIVRSGATWGSFSDFAVLMSSTDADSDDYEALNSAITAAEGHTLGFENGEYAPYNNVDALTKLAFAKSIDQGVTNPKGVVEPATTALMAANTSSWTVNASDVNAIYNGMFDSDVAGDWGLTGWTRTNGWGQQQKGVGGTYSTAYYNQPGSLKYGDTGSYTMPLKNNQTYKLTFSYRSHEEDSNDGMTISVKNSEEGINAVVFPENNSKTDWKTCEAYFKTTTAGNYILTLANSGNTWMTNVSLVKADDAAISSGTVTNYTYFKELTVGGRTFSNSKWNTLCVPFAFPKTAFEEVKVLDSVTDNGGDNVNMTFVDAGDNIDAGKPCLVKAASADATLSVTNVYIDPATYASSDAKSDGTTTVTFLGTFTGESLTSSNSNAWVVSSNKLYNVDSDVTVGAYRGYFTVETSGSGVKSLSFNLDDDVTGIQSVAVAEKEKCTIYNLAGQRVNKAQKGLYIVNGKKVLVK